MNSGFTSHSLYSPPAVLGQLVLATCHVDRQDSAAIDNHVIRLEH
jgi:hypothetical protein